MEWSRERVSVRTSVLLTVAVALLALVVGLLHIGGVALRGPLAPFIESKENTRGFSRRMNPTTPPQPTVDCRAGYSTVLNPKLYRRRRYK